jgi:hypothetical protein
VLDGRRAAHKNAGVRLFVAFLFVALAALHSGGTEYRQPEARADVSCLQQMPPAAPVDAAFRADTGGAPSTPRWTALLQAHDWHAPGPRASARAHHPNAGTTSPPQFRRFPLLI